MIIVVMRNLGARGQVAVEYLLFLVVIVIVIMAVKPILEKHLLGGENCGPGDKTLKCWIARTFEPRGPDYLRFHVRLPD